MKNKKLIVFLSILAFLTVLIVLNSTLFTLQKININWLTTKYELDSIKDYEITDEIDKGESIFLVNKTNITSKLEKDYPYLRVVSIESKFPNKLVIHSAERESLFAVKLSDNEYAVIDELGKVLKISTSSIFVGSDLGAKPIKVSFSSLSLNPSDFVVGEQIKLDSVENLLINLAYTLRESNYTPTTSKGVFLNIDVISMGESCEINFQTRNGMILCIKDAENYTTDKFLLGLERYNYFHQEGVVSGTIEVWFNKSDEKIYARYID